MKYVVVNKHRVQRNQRGAAAAWEGYDPPEPVPVFRVSDGKWGQAHYAHAIEFLEGARLVYNPDQPMPCGARVWIEAPAVQEKGR